MAKATKVKWSLGADEPEDLAEFLSNDDIVAKNRLKKTKEVLWPGKGPHTFVVKKVTLKPNKNQDDRISVMVVMQNPPKSDAASWNGYLIFDGFNITEQGTPFLKRWLKALGIEWKDFYNNTKQVQDGDKAEIIQIGKVKFGTDAVKDPTLRAIVKVKPADDYNDDEHMEIQRYLPADDDVDEDDDDDEEEVASLDDEDADDSDDEEDADDDEDEDDSDEDDDDDSDDDADDDDDDDDDDDEDDDDEDAEAALREELADLKLPALIKRGLRSAKKAKVSADDMPEKPKGKVIDWIVSVELDEPPF